MKINFWFFAWTLKILSNFLVSFLQLDKVVFYSSFSYNNYYSKHVSKSAFIISFSKQFLKTLF